MVSSAFLIAYMTAVLIKVARLAHEPFITPLSAGRTLAGRWQDSWQDSWQDASK